MTAKDDPYYVMGVNADHRLYAEMDVLFPKMKHLLTGGSRASALVSQLLQREAMISTMFLLNEASEPAKWRKFKRRKWKRKQEVLRNLFTEIRITVSQADIYMPAVVNGSHRLFTVNVPKRIR